jgi:hypothetical protein
VVIARTIQLDHVTRNLQKGVLVVVEFIAGNNTRRIHSLLMKSLFLVFVIVAMTRIEVMCEVMETK